MKTNLEKPGKITKDLLKIQNKIDSFLVRSNNSKLFWHREWLDFDNGKAYLRRGKISTDIWVVDCIQVATVEAYEMRKWFFTNVIKASEELWKKYWLSVYVENCMYDYLWISLTKRWYRCIRDDSVTQTYFKENSKL